MSELVLPHSRVPPKVLRLRLAVLGVVGLLLGGLYAGVLGLQAIGVLGPGTRVTVHLPTVGDTLGINSDVKFQGLRVGRVIEVDPAGPTAQVVVEDEHAALIPASVTARVLPGTLFGNEYVDLVADEGRTARPAAAAANGTAARPHLTDGQRVPADTSRATLRLMETFAASQRLLAAADPAQWDVALSQLARALDGRGDDMAGFIADADRFLARWALLQPQLMTDLDLLATNARTLADLEPTMVQALRDSRPIARTLTEREEQTGALLTGTTALLQGPDGLTAFLRQHRPQTARMLRASAATLQAFAARSPAFAALLGKLPRLLQNGARAVENGRIQMEGVLAPQLLDPYDADDCPRYRDLPGNCAGVDR